MERAVSVLRASLKQSLTSKAPGPFMLGHMLLHNGISSASKANSFVLKYNASVFLDKALMLEGHTAQRRTNLLDEKKHIQGQDG